MTTPDDFWYPPWEYDFLCVPGETVPLTITITPPFNQLNDTYNFTLKVYIEDNPSAYDEENLSVIVRQKAGFEWLQWNQWNPPPGGEFKALPPSIVSIRFALINTGNGFDRFLIQGEIRPSEAGWTMEIVSGVDMNGFTPELPPDPWKKSPHFIDVKVTIPPKARAGVTAQVTVNATSMFNVSLKMPPAFASVTSLQHFNFQVYRNSPDYWPVLPGSEVEFQLKINNSGNGWDTFTIRPIWDTELNPGFIASANPGNIDIDAMTTATVQYIVKVPDSVAKKTYFFTAEIKSSSPELAPVTLYFAVDVGQYYRVKLDSPDPTAVKTIPGGNLEFEVKVHNTGNGLDSIVIKDIEGAPSGWLTYTEPPEVKLLQHQEETVKVTVIVPSHFEEAPIGFHKLTVPADSLRSDAQAELDLLIEIVQFYRIEWLFQGEEITSPNRPVYWPGVGYPVRAFNPYANNEITITPDLKNYGNGRDMVTLDWYSPDPRVVLSFGYPTITLGPNVTRQIKVNIIVETDIPPGVYGVYINATSEGHGSTSRVMPIDIRIDNIDVRVPPIPMFFDPVRDVVRADLNIDRGLEITFKFKIENNGFVPVSSVLVRVFDNYVDSNGNQVRWNFFNYTTPPIAVGDRFIVGERPFTDRNPPLKWWANRSGNHSLEFWVYHPYQSDTTNDLSRLNVTVSDGPSSLETDDDRDIGWEYPAIILVAVIMSVVVIGVREWIKEIKKPLRPW